MPVNCSFLFLWQGYNNLDVARKIASLIANNLANDNIDMKKLTKNKNIYIINIFYLDSYLHFQMPK